MIIEKKPLAITEVISYLKEAESKEELMKYLKRFGKVSKERANKIKEQIRELNNPKVRDVSITKVIDFLPDTQEEINKIFTEANLNEEEANKIAEIIKNS